MHVSPSISLPAIIRIKFEYEVKGVKTSQRVIVMLELARLVFMITCLKKYILYGV